MIFTKVDALVKDIDVDKYHIETVILSSDDLNKKIIRVKSDHGNEFGIRLDKGQKLQNGSAFFIDDHHVLAIGVESQDLIVISPKDMDEMGITAHILGNTHKPIEVKDAKIYLEVDPVVEQVLTQKEIAYTIEEVVLDKPLRHVNLASQFKYGEGLVIKLVYDAMVTDNIDQVWYYDKVLTVSTQARETRQGTKMIAKQMLRLIQRLHAIPVLDDYQSKIRKGVAFGNPAIVFALYVFNKGLGCNEAIALYGYSVISTMVQNAVRAIPLGQFAGQEIVLRSFSQLEKMTQEIQELDASYLGANTPGLELAQMKHETQVFRLFMS